MMALLLTIVVLIGVFFLQKVNPFWAGLLAVVPVKIIGTALITAENGTLEPAIRGMLIGQFVWGFALLAVWLYLRYYGF